MFAVLNIVLPVFAIVGVGYLSVRYARFPQSGISGLINFVTNYAAPCLLFHAMLQVDFQAVFDLRILGGYYAASLVSFGLAVLVSMFLHRRAFGPAIIAGLSASFANGILLAIPVAQRAFGLESLPVIFSIIAFQAAIILSVATILLELSRSEEAAIFPMFRTAFLRMITNPLVGGVTLGTLANLLGLSVPEPINAITISLGTAVGPVALFGLGGALNEYAISTYWRQTLSTTVIKLVVHPVVAWIVMVPVFGVAPEIARYGVLMAAMPSGINPFVFASKYHQSQDVAAGAILMTTSLSVITVSVWVALLSF